ncbi:MAG TPA: hypothetical protein V6C89_12390 [Drouetiella sp.]|jgi:hypothetical protein
MFLPVVVFALILTVPLLISWVLIRICHIDETLPQARVSASYWGRYAGAAESVGPCTITLQDPTTDRTAPTQIPTHAVPWHP